LLHTDALAVMADALERTLAGVTSGITSGVTGGVTSECGSLAALLADMATYLQHKATKMKQAERE